MIPFGFPQLHEAVCEKLELPPGANDTLGAKVHLAVSLPWGKQAIPSSQMPAASRFAASPALARPASVRRFVLETP